MTVLLAIKAKIQMLKCNDVLRYIEEEKVCNEQFLLNYFGEKLGIPCGICSHCIESKQKNLSKEQIKAISEEILALIAYHPMSSQEICLASSYYEWEILHVLTLLLDQEKITILATNQYVTKY